MRMYFKHVSNEDRRTVGTFCQSFQYNVYFDGSVFKYLRLEVQLSTMLSVSGLEILSVSLKDMIGVLEVMVLKQRTYLRGMVLVLLNIHSAFSKHHV